MNATDGTATPGISDPKLRRRELLTLTLGAIGVVYGNIGTSPLYAMREAFHGPWAVAATNTNVLGVLSLMIWALIAVIAVKYLVVLLRADHQDQHPDHQRQDAKHVLGGRRQRERAVKRLAHGVERAGADVAVDDTKGHQGQRNQALDVG